MIHIPVRIRSAQELSLLPSKTSSIYNFKRLYSRSQNKAAKMGDAGVPRSLQQSVDSTKVSYTQLGKCGLKVSIPVLGAMSFGHKDWQPWLVDDEAEVEKLLMGAWDRGLNTWDTANVYSNGVSEEMIGRVVKKNNIPRHKLVILTKCFGTVGEEPGVMHLR